MWQEEMLGKYRGPFRLVVHRPIKSKPGFERSEWLKGETSKDDVQSEALALLSDPRDAIVDVYVYSLRDELFVCWYRQQDKVTAETEE